MRLTDEEIQKLEGYTMGTEKPLKFKKISKKKQKSIDICLNCKRKKCIDSCRDYRR